MAEDAKFGSIGRFLGGHSNRYEMTDYSLESTPVSGAKTNVQD